MTYRKMFSAFSGVCFAKNKWSTENIFLVNWKSSHFSVKCLTDLKNVKHFTSFFFSLFFSCKIFSRKLFSEKYFFKSDFSWNKRSLNVITKITNISAIIPSCCILGTLQLQFVERLPSFQLILLVIILESKRVSWL